MRRFRSMALLAGLLVTAKATPVFASDFRPIEVDKAVPAAVSQDAASETEVLRSGLKAALERVEALERRLQAVEQASGIDSSLAVSDAAQAAMRGRGLGAPAGSPQSARAPAIAAEPTTPVQPAMKSASVAVDEPDRKSAAPTEAVEAITRSEQGHFGRAFSIDLGASYVYFNGAQLNLSGFLALDAIVLGTISIDEVNSDVLTTDATVRLGITNRLQFDANVPYLWRHSNFRSGGAGANAKAFTEVDIRDNGIGDVSFGASWRMLRETYHRPDVVINVRGKAPTGAHPFGIGLMTVEGSEGNLVVPERLSTGTGVWGISGGVSLLKTIDPMVVFASFNYFHNFEGHFDDISELPDLTTPLGRVPGRVKLGNAIQFGAGVAFALNERSSLSLSFTERIVSRSQLGADGDPLKTVVGSQANIAVLNIGATFALSDRLALMSNIGAGLTRNAPGLTVSLRLPYRF